MLELVEGGDLLEYILKNGGLGAYLCVRGFIYTHLCSIGVDEPDARDISYQICDALAVRQK